MNPVAYLETGVLYCDENLKLLSEFPDECVDLIYLDPPFFSNRTYEVIWGDEAEIRSFEDRWEGGIQVYVNWMQERMVELHRILRPEGSLYLHCDWHASHYLKVMTDSVFAAGGLRNEIVWKRTSGHSDAQRFGRVHDVILYYAKGNSPKWHKTYQDYDPRYVEQYYRYQDADGRRFMSDNLSASGLAGGGYTYEWNGVTRTWRCPIETMRRLDEEGLVFYTRNGMPRRKRYLDEAKGLLATDVWNDIEALRSWHQERLGYPTQKPEGLLERIIEASSDRGDVVLDPFCGCGTTVAVAERFKRQWIGIDISPTAVDLMKRRILKLTNGAVAPKLVGMPVAEPDLLKLKPYEFQNWVIQRVNGSHSPRKSGDMGIDGFSFMHHDPIQVKQSSGVGRNVIDNFETAVGRAGKDKGYVIAFSFTKGAYEEAARAKAENGLDISLITVSDLIEVEEVPRARATPDLMSLFASQPEVIDRPLPMARKPAERPSPDQLIASDLEPVG